MIYFMQYVQRTHHYICKNKWKQVGVNFPWFEAVILYIISNASKDCFVTVLHSPLIFNEIEVKGHGFRQRYNDDG
jgi:hypothetical protein